MTAKPKRKTLDELEADPSVGLPETEYEFCVAGSMNAERERIQTELFEEAAKEERASSSRRMNQPSRVNELNAEHEKLIKRMSPYLVTIKFRAKLPHEWRDWRLAHPKREGDELDEKVDLNVDALSADLRSFIVSVNEEPMSDRWWAIISKAMAPGDEWAMTNRVIGLHSGVNAVPKSLTALLQSRANDGDSKSPERGA